MERSIKANNCTNNLNCKFTLYFSNGLAYNLFRYLEVLSFMSWFNKQSRLVQIILLIIPFVGWFVEIFVRLTAMLQKTTTENILGFVLFLFFGYVLAYVDLVWVLLFNHLILCK